jgi:hypothetical protein
MKRRKLALAGVLAFATAIAHASLIARGGGLIYDDDLGITWMANASLSVTNTFGAAGTINPTGTMSWLTAQNWIDAMNAQAYLGFGNWRLPETLYPDPTCTATSGGHSCSGSEMGHLFYNELGGVAGHDIADVHNSNYTLFKNIQPNQYWSRTTITQNPLTPDDNAWVFYFPGGVQQTIAVENFDAVWAVRDGDVVPSTVSEPAPLALASIGILALGFSRRKNKSS